MLVCGVSAASGGSEGHILGGDEVLDWCVRLCDGGAVASGELLVAGERLISVGAEERMACDDDHWGNEGGDEGAEAVHVDGTDAADTLKDLEKGAERGWGGCCCRVIICVLGSGKRCGLVNGNRAENHWHKAGEEVRRHNNTNEDNVEIVAGEPNQINEESIHVVLADWAIGVLEELGHGADGAVLDGAAIENGGEDVEDRH